MPKFELHYHKIPKITDEKMVVIQNDKKYDEYGISNVQYYHPIYQELFNLNENNFNRLSLNHRYQIINPQYVFDTMKQTTLEKDIFIKYSPLLDPIRYMIGKYKEDLSILSNLPKLTNNDKVIAKYLDPNNASYIDNFFYYLTSQVLHNHSFVNATDYYGSFLSIKKDFKIEISDDVDYLQSSNYFNEQLNHLFSIETIENPFFNYGSRCNKKVININNTPKHNITCYSLPDLNIEINNQEILDESCNLIYINDNSGNVINNDDNDDTSIEDDTSESESDNDSILSVSSIDSDLHQSQDLNENDEWETESSNNTSISSTSDELYATIMNFPCQGISIEKCNGTLDDLFENEQMSSHEGICALFQVIMILACYQKCFHFTHNDLHTNNIMYINTDEEFLYYQYKKQIYKLPTYGKIYKLIDFGRSIYRFNGRIFCSDSFAPGGDASTQYNCEPYLNDKKSRIDPNMSFDLCRLGCSLYDFIIDDDEQPEYFNDLQKVVSLWCTDDKNKNILYKKNGEERYPDFKLYKMIARTVHQHTPDSQLKLPFFKQFEVSKKNLENSITLIDIDQIPSYI